LQALLPASTVVVAGKIHCQGCKVHMLCLSVLGLFPASKIVADA